MSENSLDIRYKLLLIKYYSCVKYEHCDKIMGFYTHAGNRVQC